MKRAATEKFPTLTLRELNRAMLARQLLVERAKVDVVTAIERLAALQAQWSPSPYIALWSRLVDFRREQLWSAIERHRVIRARLMRGTLHLVSARDFFPYAVATQDLQRGAWNRLQVAKGVEPEKVAALAVSFARTPRAKKEVIAHLRERLGDVFNERYAWLVWRFVSAHADLVSAPPGGRWDYGGTDAPYVAARHWIGGDGRPSEDQALELLISYQYRDRVIAPRHRPAIYAKNAIIEAVVLVDGFAAGTWGLESAKTEAVLRVAPFARLAPRDRAAVTEEGERLARFLAPDATTTGVRVG